MSVARTERELGEIKARLAALEADQHEIKEDVRQIRDTILTARGGWKTLAAAAGFAATIGSLLTYIGLHLR